MCFFSSVVWAFWVEEVVGEEAGLGCVVGGDAYDRGVARLHKNRQQMAKDKRFTFSLLGRYGDRGG